MILEHIKKWHQSLLSIVLNSSPTGELGCWCIKWMPRIMPMNVSSYVFCKITSIKRAPSWYGQQQRCLLDQGFHCIFMNKIQSRKILRRNPAGDWLILIFSGQKPCARIIILSHITFFLCFSSAIDAISYLL